MKRNYIYAALLYAFTVAVTPAIAGQPQQEKIGRGVVAVKTDEGVFVSWRYLGTDSPSAGFNLYRDGEKLNDEPIMTSTNYVDKEGTAGSVYVVKRVDYGKETALLGNQRRQEGRLSQRTILFLYTQRLQCG